MQIPDPLEVGSKIRIINIDSTQIKYRDWLQERPPEVGDIAEVIQLYDSEGASIQIKCEPKKGFQIWCISMEVKDLEYELLSGVITNSSNKNKDSRPIRK